MNPPLRIAVADDEADMRDFLERMLPLSGHQVVSAAETGRQLVEHCRTLQPDLVITDIKMPDMDGLEASQAIYEERPVSLILVSAYHGAELMERAEAHCAMAYLVKPIVRADLEPAIVIARSRFQRFQAVFQEAADLQQALADRKVVEQAIDIMTPAVGSDEQLAFRRLQRLAEERDVKLLDAALSIIALEKPSLPS